MAIVDFEYYTNEYLGEAIAECQFPQYLKRATRAITLITHGRAADFAVLPAFQQEALKEAVCAQMEYYVQEGLEISISGDSSGGWTVGKVRVDKGGSSSVSGNSSAQSMISPGVIAILEQTGLLNPAVPVVSASWGCY